MNKRVDLLFVAFFASGFSGLIYESVWAHYVKLFLGHAAYAQTLVLVIFIGGLAAGAWVCSRMAERIRNPLRAYAWVEGAIGLLALGFHGAFIAITDWGYTTLLPSTCEQVSTFCASQWLLAAAMLLPQSVLLGMTFPLMSSAVLRADPGKPGHHIAALYFFNSFGAVLGVLASAFLLIPAAGLQGALHAAGGINLVITLVTYLASRSAPEPLAVAPAAEPGRAMPQRLVAVLLATAFLTGLSSFIYEIAWIRMLSLVLGGTTHAFELMLAAFILGLALGGAWIRNRIDRIADPIRFLAIVQIVMGIAAAATIPMYNGTFDFMAWMLSAITRTSSGYVIFNLSASAIALAVMLPATFCAGMTLPLITYRLLRSSTGERALGAVYAVNTLGSIIGVILAVHLLLGWLGLRGALIFGCAVDVLLGVGLLLYSRPASGRAVAWPAVAAVALFAIVAASFDIDPRRSASGVFRTGNARISSGEDIVFHKDGKTATVDVIDFQQGRSIRTNGKSDAAIAMSEGRPPSTDEYTMALLGLLPLGHKPTAQSAAVIGFGSGMTTTVLLGSPAIQRVDTIEIEPAMVEGARHFVPIVAPAFSDPRSHVVIDDAKSYFARGRGRYDLIVSEPSNPWVSGVASLFTQEFYQRISHYMADGGVFCQWLHTYEMDAATLGSILSAVSRTFPDFLVYSSVDSDIILIARKGGPAGEFDPAALEYPALKPMLNRLKIDDIDVIRRRQVASWRVLDAFFKSYGGRPNSDFFPVVDEWAARTRFTKARVRELIDLQSSPIPLLEMLGGAPRPASRRLDTSLVTQLETSTNVAWDVHDIFFTGNRAGGASVTLDLDFLAARLARQWAFACPAELSFDVALPTLVSIAEYVNTRLDPESAMRFWRAVAASPCASRLDPQRKRWIELFEATARRDAAAMARYGLQILDATRGNRNSASEYAFFAALTGVAIQGDLQLALGLLEKAGESWLRPNTTRVTEVRFMEATIRAAVPRSP